MNDHIDLTHWDPAADLAEPDALHLARCAVCRTTFDAQFAPVKPPLVSGRGRRILRQLQPRTPWVAGLAVAALALFAIGLGTVALGPSDPSAEAAWERYELAQASLDGGGAREAALAYLAVAPTGPNADVAAKAVTRLEPVGRRVASPQIRWLIGRSDPQSNGLWVAFLWELWCRYCLPALKRVQLADLPADVPVVALTTASKGTEDADLLRELASSGITLPTGVISGDGAAALHTGVWPTAMLVRDGRIDWVGSPEKVTRHALEAAAKR